MIVLGKESPLLSIARVMKKKEAKGERNLSAGHVFVADFLNISRYLLINVIHVSE